MSEHSKDGVCALTGSIKTDAGKNRVVPVHGKIKPILDEWMSKNGRTIFCRPDGSAYPAKQFREKYFAPALKKIGVRPFTPHATRRTFATRMAAANARPEDIEKLMGHTDYSVDVESYINQSAETLLKAIEKLA
jgi:integrase/recombinase XerD